MTENPQFVKHAAEVARAQAPNRTANEELIKLSQRLGRMTPKLQRLEISDILFWFSLYNKIKEGANKADDDLEALLKNEPVKNNPVCSPS
jgi:hypothetical protein